MSRGEPVTVAAAAAEEGISRATAYRYFSDAQVLANEAGLAVKVRPYEEVIAGCVGPRAKTIAVALYIFDLSFENEAAFRQFLARNLDSWLAHGPGDRRGARRVEMFEAALKESGLNKSNTLRLVNGLTAASGTEAMIALFDIAKVDLKASRQAIRDVAEALLDKFGVKE
jgi:hypothetical protein